jgi:hypothetical protein
MHRAEHDQMQYCVPIWIAGVGVSAFIKQERRRAELARLPGELQGRQAQLVAGLQVRGIQGCGERDQVPRSGGLMDWRGDAAPGMRAAGMLGQEQSNGVLVPGVNGGIQRCPAIGVARGGWSLGCQQSRHLLRQALSGGEVQGGLTGEVGDGGRHARLKPERGERQPIRQHGPMQRRLAQVVGGPDHIRVRREQSTGGCQVTQAGRGQGIAARAALLQQGANASPAFRLEVLAFLGGGGGLGEGLKKRRPI